MANERQSGSPCDKETCESCRTKPSAPADRDIDTERIERSLSTIRYKFLVMSGKGGVGKSSISTSLAVGMSQKGMRVGLMDVDLHGPSIATMMGIEQPISVTPDQRMIPKSYNDYLKVISIDYLLQDKDQPVIWRGPVKMGAIRQFITDVQWGELDVLIIDAPPGTGDEPLSVAQAVKDAKAIVVTTPQDVALADVRKSINFCRKVDLQILGIVENMGPFTCPCCGETVEVFKSGGGKALADQMNIPLLGTLPFEPKLVKACDAGRPMLSEKTSTEFSRAIDACIVRITEELS